MRLFIICLLLVGCVPSATRHNEYTCLDGKIYWKMSDEKFWRLSVEGTTSDGEWRAQRCRGLEE